MSKRLKRVASTTIVVLMGAALVALAIYFIPSARAQALAIWQTWHAPDIQTGMAEAELAMGAGEPKRALDIVAEVVRRQASDANVDNEAGNLATRGGDTDAAEHYYRLGEDADAKNPWNFVALGELLASQGRYPDADVQLRSALTIAPTAQFLHYDLGVVELKERLYLGALEDFRAELKRSPGYQPAAQGESEALAGMGKPSKVRATKIALAARPSPSPLASPSPNSSPSPSASPSPTPTATPAPVPSPTPTLALAQVVLPSPTPAATATPHVKPRPKKHPPVKGTPTVVAQSTPPNDVTSGGGATHHSGVPPAVKPLPISDLAVDAKSYLLGVASDLGFTQTIPAGDPSMSTSSVQAEIDRARGSTSGSIDAVLNAGVSALLSGRLALAASAFSTAAERAPNDWRGPYFDGVTAQVRGDNSAAAIYFNQAVARGGGAAAYVSLAIAQANAGDESSALASAKRAALIAPSYEPARFTAGMLALVYADAPTAERELAAAVDIGGAPSRTSYFLSALRRREAGIP